MKKIIFSIAATLAVAATLHAGTADKKLITPLESTDIGSGLYVGVQGGLNAYQDGINAYGTDAKKKVGWTTGLKVGYVFGGAQDIVRPAAELEGIYSAFDRHFDGSFDDTSFTEKVRASSFAYMANGIAKFNLGAFQPYVGAGVGFYSMKARFATKVDDLGQFNGGSEDRDGFAWQLLGGVDYYFTPKLSVFTEYKWLNYEVRNSSDFLGDPRIGQQLVSAGVRVHF
jgi:opacity protein-like surface antigen